MLNNFQAVPQPTVQTPQITHDDAAHQRKSAYAAMSDLSERFNTAGIETDQVWECIKAEHGVDSRAKFNGFQWARVAAELQGAKRDDVLFKILLDRIPDKYFRIHVYADNPAVCIGRPRDMRKHHIAEEWGDFQQLANDSKCGIRVEQGKRTTYYEPVSKPEPKPVKVSKPESVSKRDDVFDMNINAHGQVLNVFGDVVEVRA